MKYKPLPSVERAKELLDYNPETGIFTWKVAPNKSTEAGSVAGSLMADGYIRIRIKRSSYYLHRIAWLYAYGQDPAELQIDHINGDKADNRIENLRLVTHQQNQQNRPKSLGIAFSKPTGRWKAQIRVNGTRKTLGYFDCPLMAGLAYKEAKAALHPFSNPQHI